MNVHSLQSGWKISSSNNQAKVHRNIRYFWKIHVFFCLRTEQLSSSVGCPLVFMCACYVNSHTPCLKKRPTLSFAVTLTRLYQYAQEAQLSLGWPTVLPHSRRSMQKLWRIHANRSSRFLVIGIARFNRIDPKCNQVVMVSPHLP